MKSRSIPPPIPTWRQIGRCCGSPGRPGPGQHGIARSPRERLPSRGARTRSPPAPGRPWAHGPSPRPAPRPRSSRRRSSCRPPTDDRLFERRRRGAAQHRPHRASPFETPGRKDLQVLRLRLQPRGPASPAAPHGPAGASGLRSCGPDHQDLVAARRSSSALESDGTDRRRPSPSSTAYAVRRGSWRSDENAITGRRERLDPVARADHGPAPPEPAVLGEVAARTAIRSAVEVEHLAAVVRGSPGESASRASNPRLRRSPHPPGRDADADTPGARCGGHGCRERSGVTPWTRRPRRPVEVELRRRR